MCSWTPRMVGIRSIPWDVWDHRHRMLKSWNQLIFSSWAFWHHLPFLLFSLTAHNLCCLYARNRRGAVGAKARMNKLDRRVPQCLDKDALSLLHTSPWSLEPGRAIVNIHMQSISAQGKTPLTKNTPNNTIFGTFGAFLPYFACGGIFLLCRWPGFSQVVCMRSWGPGFRWILGSFWEEPPETFDELSGPLIHADSP